MALISQADIEARLGRSLSAEEANSLNIINPAIQSYVEKMIGSSVESVSATARLYDGGVQNLTIDPCTDISSVKYIDENGSVEFTFDSSEYTSEPINRTCKTWIRNRWSNFNSGFNNIQVTAKFSIYGDSQILAIIKNALIDAVVSEIQNNGNIKRELIEGYSVEYATSETKTALDSIKYLFPEI